MANQGRSMTRMGRFKFIRWTILLVVISGISGLWILYKAIPILHARPVKAQPRNTQNANTVKEDTRKGTCPYPLGPSRSDDLAKIKSYKFDGIRNYTKVLFPPHYKHDARDSRDVPVFISAISSNHILEFYVLLVNLEEVVRPNYKDWKFLVYDIGLEEYERDLLTRSGFVEVRDIPYDKLPSHVRQNKYYAWKPIVTLLAIMEYKYVFWVDASIRFKTGNLDELFAAGKTNGLMGNDFGVTSYGTIPQATARAQFDYLNEDPCTFSEQGTKPTGIILTYANDFIYENYLRPWISCALKYECMVTDEGSRLPWSCDYSVYHSCHRFEQSFHGMLYSRLFHNELATHKIDPELYYVCRMHKICLKS